MNKIQKIIQKTTKWLLTSTSVVTMVMLPVAQGQAAQTEAVNITKSQVQSAVTQLGLNKSMTLGDFYKKNKKLYPERIRAQLEKFILDNKNYVMPTFEVTSAKNSEGKEIQAVRISKDGELVNIQVFGEQDKYVKFNNTNLTELDIINFKDMFLKLNNGDANLRKQVEKSELALTNSKVTTKSTIEEIPEITLAAWNKLSMKERVSYIQQLRLLYIDAANVNSKLKKQPNRKTSSFFEKIYQLVIEEAAAEKVLKKGAPKASTRTNSAYDGSCVVAGYISEYVDGTENVNSKNTRACSVDAAITNYKAKNISWVNEALSECQGKEIACNPLVYGFNSDSGKAICVDKTSKPFQSATHFVGPCDTKSRLTSGETVAKIQFDDNKKYDTSAKRHDDEKNLILNDPENATNSALFIAGILKRKNSDLYKLITATSLTEEDFNKLKEEINSISEAANSEIKSAVDACENVINNKFDNSQTVFSEQKLACDQLHRRLINSEPLLKKLFDKKVPTPTVVNKCPEGTTIKDYSQSGVYCKCNNPQSAGHFTLAEATASTFDVQKECATPNPSPGTSASSDVTRPTPAVGSCVNGSIETNTNGAEVCVPNKPTKPEKEKESWFSGFFKKALPWLVGGIALFAMYKLWSPKTPSLNSAGDYCPNGTKPPCGQTCTSPQANINGVCGCAACPPGQTLTNAATCTCSSSSGNPTEVTCADGVTKAPTLAQCPATQYTCWDGSKVTNPINCPEKPATTSSGSGSSGK